LAHLLKTTARDAKLTKRLWKGRNEPLLIKAGLALIAFPDPTISDVVGMLLLVAGTVQEGIQRQTLYVDDLPRALTSAVNELKAIRDFV
jgi:hypothetical protein